MAVIPSVKKFALGLGGRWGKGAVVCRTTDGWGPPLMISLGGGSFGFQIGGQAADYVFLVMNPKGIDYLLRSTVHPGGGRRSGRRTARADRRSRDRPAHAGRDPELLADPWACSPGSPWRGRSSSRTRTRTRRSTASAWTPRGSSCAAGYRVPASARGLVDLLRGVSPRTAAD